MKTTAGSDPRYTTQDPPTHPKLNHQDTKAAKKLAKCFSMFFRQIGKRCPNSSENRGILKPDDPETKELLGVLGALVVNRVGGGCYSLSAATSSIARFIGT